MPCSKIEDGISNVKTLPFLLWKRSVFTSFLLFLSKYRQNLAVPLLSRVSGINGKVINCGYRVVKCLGYCSRAVVGELAPIVAHQLREDNR